MDQCTHCSLRGNLNECLSAECSQHESWMVGELKEASGRLADVLRDIAKQDPVEMAFDPQWAARIARITLTVCGYEA